MGNAFRFYRHGGPEVMQWEDVELPPPAAGQVRMRNIAVAVNYRDVLIRRGIHEVRTFPSGIGLESAGVVEGVGPGVADIAVGDRIACTAGPDGAYAQARNVPAARAVKLPGGIDERTAAAMMIRGMTARYLLHDTYAVKPGDAILVHAAAGGVGLLLCQWAKHLGATVIGTVSTEDKAAVARAHGCDHAIVYGRDDFVARVKDITNGDGVAVVYDSVGRDTFEGSMRCLRPRGVLASYGEASGDPEPVPPRKLGQTGSIWLTHPSLPDYTATRADLLTAANDLFAMVLSGKLKVAISHVYALQDAPQAHADLEARKTTGSIVLIA
jgi:NADPH:quinone reductase